MNKNIEEKFDAKEWYLTHFRDFEKNLNGRRDIAFQDTRKAAISRFEDLGFPTPKEEDWKYTNVAPILAHRFNLPKEPVQISATDIEKARFKGLDNTVVLVNGQFSEELSTVKLEEKGVVVESLKEALSNRYDLVAKYLGRLASFEEESFTALNTAFTHDGLFVYVPKGVAVEEPLHIIYHAEPDREGVVNHPRNLIVVEESGQFQFVESFHAGQDAPYFNNSVTEIVVNRNANVEHIRVQEDSEHAFHIANTQIHQERDSVFHCVNLDIGGKLVRNNLNVRLNGENCETHLFGFYFGRYEQHIDNHTFIDHAKPHCFSNELFKGVLDDKARGVFSGKILVRQDAQKTNALQSNKTLLLTDDAEINAKPQLEIFADDVKCTHGATIGQLDEEALFYLRARGIDEETAGAMLRYAFASDVFENIKIAAVRKKLDTLILERLRS